MRPRRPRVPPEGGADQLTVTVREFNRPGWETLPVQFSLFGAEAAQPVLADLDGLLFSGGDWVFEPDGATRLSVLVSDRWRADALGVELAARGLASDIKPETVQATEHFAVRTELTPSLTPQAARWRRGASLRVPPDLTLSTAGLRLWAIASGQLDDIGYLLGTSERNVEVHRAGGAQLAGLGIAAVELTGRAGPGWRVTSVKRLRRLAELLGQQPFNAERDWLNG